MSQEIHLGDIGTAFRITLKDGNDIVDVSSAVGVGTKTITFKKKDGTVVEKEATFFTNGVDGVIQYITIEDDLDQLGSWEIQAKVTLTSGTWRSNTDKFRVYENL